MFLLKFYDATIYLSWVYYLTSPLMVHSIVDIHTHLNAYESDELLLEVVARMKLNYLKHWKEIHMLYAFALILDPRAKLVMFANALDVLVGSLHLDYSAYFMDVRDKLFEVT